MFCLWKDPELYGEYDKINSSKIKTIKSKDGEFYYNLGLALYKEGYRNFDEISIASFLDNKPEIKEKFDKYGGYREVDTLKNIVNESNVEAYYDAVCKINTLEHMASTFKNISEDSLKFKNFNNQQVYDYFDYCLNSISLANTLDMKIEDLVIDDDFISTCNAGDTVGLNYSKNCPILNYLTLGLPLGELYMLAGHSGTGKSSFVFENMVLPLGNAGTKCAIISNEMRAKDYKLLLITHILTQDLNYYGITRKKLKMGNFNDEQMEMLMKAKQISKEKYGNIMFVKMFDTDVNKCIKFIKKLSKRGYQMFVWDTMKSDDTLDDNMWQQLLMNSRKIFQTASKENISIVTTYQLALHTTNKRYLDANCLSNSKQIKEVFSEMVYMRPLWQDEMTDEKFDCHPYTFKKDASGKYNNEKTRIYLDSDKKYIVAFLDKTRNDEDKQQIIYEWKAHYNCWKEIGYCQIFNDHT